MFRAQVSGSNHRACASKYRIANSALTIARRTFRSYALRQAAFLARGPARSPACAPAPAHSDRARRHVHPPSVRDRLPQLCLSHARPLFSSSHLGFLPAEATFRPYLTQTARICEEQKHWACKERDAAATNGTNETNRSTRGRFILVTWDRDESGVARQKSDHA